MRAFLGTVLSVIAVGVLLIAYGLLSPRAAAAPWGPTTDAYASPYANPYQTARPVPASDIVSLGQPAYDPSKPPGRGQQAPLTPEYQAIFEANEADQQAGGFGTTTGWRCLAWGMPAMMNVFQPMEIIVTPDITYIRTSDTRPR